MRLLNSRPRGDSKDFYTVAEFYNGRRFEGGTALRPNKQSGASHTYYLYLNEHGVAFEGPR